MRRRREILYVSRGQRWYASCIATLELETYPSLGRNFKFQCGGRKRSGSINNSEEKLINIIVVHMQKLKPFSSIASFSCTTILHVFSFFSVISLVRLFAIVPSHSYYVEPWFRLVSMGIERPQGFQADTGRVEEWHWRPHDHSRIEKALWWQMGLDRWICDKTRGNSCDIGSANDSRVSHTSHPYDPQPIRNDRLSISTRQ